MIVLTGKFCTQPDGGTVSKASQFRSVIHRAKRWLLALAPESGTGVKKHVRSSLAVLVFLSAYGSATLKAEQAKVAFIGDQGIDDNAMAVLSLIASEEVDLLVIQGDLGYDDSAATQWRDNLVTALGEGFPVLAVVGNHETAEWPVYQSMLTDMLATADELSCRGEVGVKAVCQFRHIDIVQVAPGINEVDGVLPDDDYPGFIQASLPVTPANDRWKICTWHKNQSSLQTGSKPDATGWEVYDACLAAGAFVVVGHEHAYSRTHLLSDFEQQTIVHTDNTLALKPGQSFMAVSGLGGRSIRDQEQDGDWWASVYTATQGATHGALICEFDDRTAACKFNAIDGAQPDRFALVLAEYEPVTEEDSDAGDDSETQSVTSTELNSTGVNDPNVTTPGTEQPVITQNRASGGAMLHLVPVTLVLLTLRRMLRRRYGIYGLRVVNQPTLLLLSATGDDPI